MTPNSSSLFHVTIVSVWDKCVEGNKTVKVQPRQEWQCWEQTGRKKQAGSQPWGCVEKQPRIRGPRSWTWICFSLDLVKCLWEIIETCFSYGGGLNIGPTSLATKNTEKTWPSAHVKPKDVLQSLTVKNCSSLSPTCTFSTLVLGCVPSVCDLHLKIIQTLTLVQTVPGCRMSHLCSLLLQAGWKLLEIISAGPVNRLFFRYLCISIHIICRDA